MTTLKRQRLKLQAQRAASTRRRVVVPHRLIKFIPWASRGRLVAPTHLGPMVDVLERAATETVEACFSVPPRHGKTTTVLYAIAWMLARDPSLTVLYVSYAHGFAAKQVRKIRKIALEIGLAMGDVRRRDEWTTAAGGGVKAAGIDGQLTGEGFRVVVVDDPHKNRAEAESRLMRDNVFEAFKDDIYTRQDPRGTSFIVIHTRWHVDDLIGRLTRPTDEDDEPFLYVNLPAIAGAANDGRYDERALAPDLWPMSKLRKLRAKLGEYAWWSLYMGSPRPRGGEAFGDVHLVEEVANDPDSYVYAIGVDLAHTAKTRSDWNVAAVLRRSTRTGLIDVVEVVRRQGTLTRRRPLAEGDAPELGFAADIARLQRKYPGARTVQYTGRDEELVLELLGMLKDQAAHVEARPATTDKLARALPYSAAWNDGRARVLRAAKWAGEFIEEHRGFTGGPRDVSDQIDAAAAAFDVLNEGLGIDVLTPQSASSGRTGRGRLGRRTRWT